MKKILLCFLLLAFIKNNSQDLILTKAAFEPVIGDSSKAFIVDTSAYAFGLNVSLTGSNTVWTYTNLIATSNTTSTQYVDPLSVPASSNYAGCSVVQKQGTLYTYFKSVALPITQLEFMGVSSTSLNMTFTNNAIYSRYPFAFGDSFTDSFSGSFTFSVNGTAAGNATVTADGTGTLNLPNDTLNNVLRVKSEQNTNFTAFGFPAGSLKMTKYDFYHASEKFPVFTINYQTITSGGNPTVTAVVSGNKNNFIQGVKENSISEFNPGIYPNPAGNILNITTDDFMKPREIKIFNQMGQIVFTSPFANHIDVSALESGIYFIEVKTENGTSRKKFIHQAE